MKAVLRFVAIFWVTLAISPGPVWAESLADALRDAYKHSGLLEQNRALLRAADEDVASAAAALRPVVSYSMTGSYSSITQTTSSNLTLSASLLLYDFGSSELRRSIAQESVLSTREALRGVEQNVLLRAVSAYMSVRRDSNILSLRQNNLRLIEQELQAARDRFDVGEITRTDVAQAEAGVAAAQSALAAARGNLDQSREEYRAAVGHYPGNLTAPPASPKTAASLEGARQVALARHPDMAQASSSVKVAELNVQMAQASLKPKLSAGANASIADGGTDTSSLSLTLSGPIYQGGAIVSSVRKAQAQADAARAALHITRHAIDQAVGNAWSQLAVAEAGLRASEQQIAASRIAMDGVRQEAELGARTTLDVLDAEQLLLDAESARVSAETGRVLAVYNLLAAMGLLNTQQLGLGVATYDPKAYYDAVKNAPSHMVSPQGQKLDGILKALGKQ